VPPDPLQQLGLSGSLACRGSHAIKRNFDCGGDIREVMSTQIFFEVCLANSSPGQPSALHDHGGKEGGMYI
jgi:hypothetical protein